MNKLKALLHSRRFWAAAIGVLSVVFSETLGVELSDEIKAQLVSVLIGIFVVGDSVRETK